MNFLEIVIKSTISISINKPTLPLQGTGATQTKIQLKWGNPNKIKYKQIQS